MKWTAIVLIALIGILAVLWFTIGGTVLAIVLSIFSGLLVTICTFSLGIWYAHKSIKLGAELAIEAQSNNDQWDTVKMQSLAQFGQQMLKMKGGDNNGLPLLESNNDTFDASFSITGIDNNE